MNEIIINNYDGQLTVSSVQVAKDFKKEHQHVTQAIENLTSENSLVKSLFIESSYINERGREYKCYDLTRDGFSLLVMGFTGKKALEWKLKYIEAFNLMEQTITNQQKQLNAVLIQAKADRAKAMRLNAENRRLKLLFDNPQWKDMQLSGIGIETLGLKRLEELTGTDVGNLLPECERTWSATEVGKILGGITSQAIGRKANMIGIKNDEYGKMVMDKSRYSNKEVASFRYNIKGIDMLAEAFGIKDYKIE